MKKFPHLLSLSLLSSTATSGQNGRNSNENVNCIQIDGDRLVDRIVVHVILGLVDDALRVVEHEHGE